MRFGLILPSFSFPDLDYAKAARLREFAVKAEVFGLSDRLWPGEPVSHTGRYYHFDDVVIDPPLPQKPFLWLAGGSKLKTDLSPDPEVMAPTVLERICRRADGWLARAAGSTDSVIADWTQIQRRLDAIGRPRDGVAFGHVNLMHRVPTDEE